MGSKLATHIIWLEYSALAVTNNKVNMLAILVIQGLREEKEMNENLLEVLVLEKNTFNQRRV